MKQCSKSENVLIIDSDYEEADGFIKGVREVTGEEWQVHICGTLICVRKKNIYLKIIRKKL